MAAARPAGVTARTVSVPADASVLVASSTMPRFVVVALGTDGMAAMASVMNFAMACVSWVRSASLGVRPAPSMTATISRWSCSMEAAGTIAPSMPAAGLPSI